MGQGEIEWVLDTARSCSAHQQQIDAVVAGIPAIADVSRQRMRVWARSPSR
jgi:hypothetical protein